MASQLLKRDGSLIGPLDNLVINVGDVHLNAHVVAEKVEQNAAHNVEADVVGGMADVGRVVHGGAAYVPREGVGLRLVGHERQLGGGEAVEDVQLGVGEVRGAVPRAIIAVHGGGLRLARARRRHDECSKRAHARTHARTHARGESTRARTKRGAIAGAVRGRSAGRTAGARNTCERRPVNKRQRSRRGRRQARRSLIEWKQRATCATWRGAVRRRAALNCGGYLRTTFARGARMRSADARVRQRRVGVRDARRAGGGRDLAAREGRAAG
ncbi:hypothetical protein FGB62_30g337 [Gracilaria domingensis]|nr:hypothetical protein FGB62_30g337 [Gracilaria domingensis]